jgi:peptidoglycan/LPS O-acetylase OafA/YrhL
LPGPPAAAELPEAGRRSAGSYRPDIDGLRAVAVISVVLFHAGFRRFGGGFVGVDIFFVISGFLITRIVRDQVARGDFSFGAFYVRRLRRLFPALAATVGLTLAAAAVLMAPDLFRTVGASAAAATGSVANIYFWLNSGYFDPASSLNPLLHTWSLSVEEQFYLVWPLLLGLAARRRAAVPLLVGLAAASIVAGLVFRTDPSAVFYLMPFRVFELASGGLLVWLVERAVVPAAVREAGLLVGLGLIALAVLTFSPATPFPLNGIVPCAGAALVIVCGNAARLGRLLRNRLAVGIGLISYSVYLVHWPLVVLYVYAVGRELGLVERLAMVGLALGAGLALNRLVEVRFRYARPTSFRPARFALACGALAAVMAGVGLHAAATGWTWRLGDREAAFLDIRDFYGGAACRPPRCETGPADGRPLIVIGDSHGRAYFAGLAANLPERRLVVYEVSACYFFSPDKTRDYGQELAQYDGPCRAARRRAFDEIRATDADVVVAQNWAAPVDMLSETSSERWPLATDAAFIDFAGRELQQLKGSLGIENLVVIGNIPTMGGRVSALDCIARPVRLNDLGCTATPIDNARLSRRQDANATLRESVAAFASFADPYDYLCEERECANFLDAQPLYINNDHLTELGSSLVVEGILSGSTSGGLTH